LPEPEPRVATPAGAAAWPRPPSAHASVGEAPLFEFAGAGDAEGALLPLPLAGGDPWSLDDLILRF
jgi:hypothetical protein